MITGAAILVVMNDYMTKPKPVQISGVYDLIKNKGISKPMQAVFMAIWHFLQEHTKKQRQRQDAWETRLGKQEAHMEAMQKKMVQQDD